MTSTSLIKPPSSTFSINISSANITNCRSIYVTEGHPAVATLAFLSIIFNVVVIIVIQDMSKRRITSATPLFIALAVSDLVVSLFFAIPAIMNWGFDSCSLPFTVGIHVFDQCQVLSICANRGITLLVTAKRAEAVSSRKVLRVRNNNVIKTRVIFWTQLIVFVTIASLPSIIDLSVSLKYLSVRGRQIMWLVYFVCLTVTLLSLSIYIHVSLHLHSRSMTSDSRHSRSTTQDDFQKLVVFVSTVFCCCQFVSIYFQVKDMGLDLGDKTSGGPATTDQIKKWVAMEKWIFYFATVFNSAINLFIYMATSPSFRRSLLGYFRRLAPTNENQLVTLTSVASRSNSSRDS